MLVKGWVENHFHVCGKEFKNKHDTVEYLQNKPATQATGADPSQWNLITKQNSASPLKMQ